MRVPPWGLVRPMETRIKALRPDQIEANLLEHIPHRLVLLTTFRDRQPWFEESSRAGQPDGDLLRVAKESPLLSIRIFGQFLGLRLKAGRLIDGFPETRRKDDVYVDDLGGQPATLNDLLPGEPTQLQGLLRRADKELAHLTTDFTGHDDFCTVKALCCGIDLIERLLRKNVYDVVVAPDGRKYPFPDLKRERKIWGTGYEILDGPLPSPHFPRQ